MLLINQIHILKVHIGRRQKSPEIHREHEMSLFLSEANISIVNGDLSAPIGSASKDLEEQEDEAERSLLSLKPCLFGHLGMSPHTDALFFHIAEGQQKTES